MSDKNTITKQEVFDALSDGAKILYNRLMEATKAPHRLAAYGYAILVEGVQLEEPLSEDTLAQVEELRKANLDVAVSQGDSQRAIHLVGVKQVHHRTA